MYQTHMKLWWTFWSVNSFPGELLSSSSVGKLMSYFRLWLNLSLNTASWMWEHAVMTTWTRKRIDLTDCGVPLDLLYPLDCDFPLGIHLPYQTYEIWVILEFVWWHCSNDNLSYVWYGRWIPNGKSQSNGHNKSKAIPEAVIWTLHYVIGISHIKAITGIMWISSSEPETLSHCAPNIWLLLLHSHMFVLGLA